MFYKKLIRRRICVACVGISICKSVAYLSLRKSYTTRIHLVQSQLFSSSSRGHSLTDYIIYYQVELCRLAWTIYFLTVVILLFLTVFILTHPVNFPVRGNWSIFQSQLSAERWQTVHIRWEMDSAWTVGREVSACSNFVSIKIQM